MYDRDFLVLLRHYLDLELSKSAIAAQLGVHHRTLRYWIQSGQLDRGLSDPAPRRPAPRAQKLDPFKPLIQERLTTYPLLSSVRLLAECRATGYDGGVTQLREYVAGIRPRPVPEPILRFETPPGVQAQFDVA